ncbi:uncharacterized protein LOC122242040 isoform X2 [Panthera tigris]|uniref:uncharacterized protein LOC122242040 isoform X2 n=1 Tax=Panthera tigris TaxID=9694 RepID=UPI001C6FA9C3|nr:uncharacterized protein LOC122242040 isoform X2 [Panthera tigris]
MPRWPMRCEDDCPGGFWERLSSRDRGRERERECERREGEKRRAPCLVSRAKFELILLHEPDACLFCQQLLWKWGRMSQTRSSCCSQPRGEEGNCQGLSEWVERCLYGPSTKCAPKTTRLERSKAKDVERHLTNGVRAPPYSSPSVDSPPPTPERAVRPVPSRRSAC